MPEGYRLVPVVPTEEMLQAAVQHVYFWDTNLDDLSRDQEAEARLVYRAMLDAAPTPKE